MIIGLKFFQELGYLHKNEFKKTYINKDYQIYANSFTINDNNKKTENENWNVLNIYIDKNISLQAKRNNEIRENKSIKFELKSPLKKSKKRENPKYVNSIFVNILKKFYKKIL